MMMPPISPSLVREVGRDTGGGIGVHDPVGARLLAELVEARRRLSIHGASGWRTVT